MFSFDTDQDRVHDQIQDPVIMKPQNQENVGQDQEINLVQDHIRTLDRDRDHIAHIESIRKNQAKRKRRKIVIEVRVVVIMNIVVNQIVKNSLLNIVLD